MTANIIVLQPGQREDLRTAFRFAREMSVFGRWENCTPGTEEKDAYDEEAAYVLAIDKQEEILFGVRVITKTGSISLPIEKHVSSIAFLSGSVEFSRALRVKESPPIDATRVYRELFRMYHDAPGAYASIRERYMESLMFQFGRFIGILPGRPFRKDDDTFIPVEFLVEEARRVFDAANAGHRLKEAA